MPKKSNSVAASQKFSAQALLMAIQTSESILGRGATDSLIYDLERQGLQLASAYEEYSIEEIRAALEKIFGIETTSFLLRHIIKALSAKIE